MIRSSTRDAVRRAVSLLTERARLWGRLIIARTSLRRVYERGSLRDAEVVLVSVMRNDAGRLPYWLRYYRELGVDHFIIVDNHSSDDTLDYLKTLESVTVYRTSASYKRSRYGVDWVNAVLHSRRVRTWVAWVDSDEFLSFDRSEEKSLKNLTQLLQARGLDSLQCLLLDLYSEREVWENIVPAGGDPFAACSLFDREGYTKSYDSRTSTTWIKGGVRARLFFPSDLEKSPALNKTPLIRWRRASLFVQGTHRLSPHRLNSQSITRGLTGVLLHQKFLASVGEKVADDEHVAQHDGEYTRYTGYAQATAYRHDVTRTFRSSANLVENELMSPINWGG